VRQTHLSVTCRRNLRSRWSAILSVMCSPILLWESRPIILRVRWLIYPIERESTHHPTWGGWSILLWESTHHPTCEAVDLSYRERVNPSSNVRRLIYPIVRVNPSSYVWGCWSILSWESQPIILRVKRLIYPIVRESAHHPTCEAVNISYCESQPIILRVRRLIYPIVRVNPSSYVWGGWSILLWESAHHPTCEEVDLSYCERVGPFYLNI
jgi:hypothetical protein